MAKWLCFVIVAILLIPNIGANEKRMNGKDENNMKENDMQHFNNFHHPFFADFIYRIFPKMKNYAPVALMKKYGYKGIAGKPIIFDASLSYDPNGDALKYRWDFDNDGVYDTGWLSSPKAMHVYAVPYNGFVKLEVKDEYGLADECIARVLVTNAATSSITGEVDQSQEKADGYVKIYQQYWYAQSFKPSKCGFDGIDLLIARKGIASYGMASIVISIEIF